LRLPAAGLAIVLCLTPRVGAQTGTALPAATLDQSASRLGITLFGGWASFSQTSVNHLIRMDNLLLTSPVDDGGIGLERGLDQITDAITFGVEVSWRLKKNWEAYAGFERLRAGSRLEFEYDSGSGPEDSHFEYRTDDWPIHAGLRYTFRFSDRFSYRVGAAAVIFPVSRLRVSGHLGGLVSLDQEGTVTGIGAALTWGGVVRLNGPLALQTSVRLRFGRAGDPKDADGDVIVDPVQGEPVTLDWSGVDIIVGLLIDLF
jgi:hypothetical protein